MIATNESKAWLKTVKLQGKEVVFKLDTGAEVTVVSEKVFFILSTGKLEKPSKVLHGPAGQKLEVLGQFEGNLSHGSRHIRQTIFVVKSHHKNLLGLPAITALDLVHKVNAPTTGAQVSDNSFMERFPKVFQGLGTWGDEYTIKLQDDA